MAYRTRQWPSLTWKRMTFKTTGVHPHERSRGIVPSKGDRSHAGGMSRPPNSRAFDELWGAGADGHARPGFEKLAAWLDDMPRSELARLQQSAEAAFRSLGITFAVYGDDQAAERIIPFDILPRIFSAREWEKLTAGLEQRVRSINAFIDDVYGARRILADGIVPADIVLSNPQL